MLFLANGAIIRIFVTYTNPIHIISAMNRTYIPLIGLTIALTLSAANDTAPTTPRPAIQHPDAGSIDRLYIPSPQLGEEWTVDVWIPEGYASDATHKYPVIYMHDGQNLFDANTTWNHQAWEMDSVTSSLIASGAIEAPIIVSIHSHADTRKGDLMPQKAAESSSFSPQQRDSLLGGIPIRGDAYARFIVETLKPDIDSLYRTLPDRNNTTVMGSSMGGLMSIYAMSEYPDVFGNAICMSTHWIGNPDNAEPFACAMYRYLDRNLPRDGQHKLYLDHGTETLDSLYGPWEEMMITLVKTCGYNTPETLQTYIAPGAAHTETSWAARVDRPLRFIFGKNKQE